MAEGMKLSEIYERAAEIRSRDGQAGCCLSISLVEKDPRGYSTPAQRWFATIFKPEGGGLFRWWDDDDNASRILALCFAAAIARSEGL